MLWLLFFLIRKIIKCILTIACCVRMLVQVTCCYNMVTIATVDQFQLLYILKIEQLNLQNNPVFIIYNRKLRVAPKQGCVLFLQYLKTMSCLPLTMMTMTTKGTLWIKRVTTRTWSRHSLISQWTPRCSHPRDDCSLNFQTATLLLIP